MKRADLERHLRQSGCGFEREGANHTIWRNPVTGRKAQVPRHGEIKFPTARSICERLGIPILPGK
jgi:mRNA interferase HicA